MSEEIETKDLSVVLIPVDAQPPTFGMVMSIMAVSDKYDEVVICVRDNPILIPTNSLLKMLSVIFRLPKFMVISHTQDFDDLVEFPRDLPFFTHVATLSERAYVAIATKGYGVYLIPRAIGYDDYFHRVAWRQSHALELLRSHTRQVSFDSCRKPEPSKQEEGDD
jgi:hypothetical protein